MLPEVTAKEVRTLYSAARNDHDLRRAAMFLKLICYSYSSGCKVLCLSAVFAQNAVCARAGFLPSGAKMWGHWKPGLETLYKTL